MSGRLEADGPSEWTINRLVQQLLPVLTPKERMLYKKRTWEKTHGKQG